VGPRCEAGLFDGRYRPMEIDQGPDRVLARRVLSRLRRAAGPADSGEGNAYDRGGWRRRAARSTTIANDVHALPGIFHYWSDKYLRPKLEAFGFSNPDQFFRDAHPGCRASRWRSDPRREASDRATAIPRSVVARLLRDKGLTGA